MKVISPVEASFDAVPVVLVPPKVMVRGIPRLPPPLPPRPVASIKLVKVESVLRNYGLFTLTDYTFRSNKLDAMMRPLENKRRSMEKQNERKVKARQNQSTHNNLKINDGSSLSKVKESKEEKSKVSSSKEEDAVASVPTALAWERYVDELAKEEQWIEVMAMRSPDRTVRQCGVKGNGCVHF